MDDGDLQRDEPPDLGADISRREVLGRLTVPLLRVVAARLAAQHNTKTRKATLINDILWAEGYRQTMGSDGDDGPIRTTAGIDPQRFTFLELKRQRR